jgi:hypothetical protein
MGSSRWTPFRNRSTGGDRLVQVLVLLLQIHKVGNVQEGVAFESNIDECRLHARQHARYTAFVDGAR